MSMVMISTIDIQYRQTSVNVLTGARKGGRWCRSTDQYAMRSMGYVGHAASRTTLTPDSTPSMVEMTCQAIIIQSRSRLPPMIVEGGAEGV